MLFRYLWEMVGENGDGYLLVYRFLRYYIFIFRLKVNFFSFMSFIIYFNITVPRARRYLYFQSQTGREMAGWGEDHVHQGCPCHHSAQQQSRPVAAGWPAGAHPSQQQLLWGKLGAGTIDCPWGEKEEEESEKQREGEMDFSSLAHSPSGPTI